MADLRQRSLALLASRSKDSDIERIDALEEFLRKELPLVSGPELEREVLDTLWAERLSSENTQPEPAPEPEPEPEPEPLINQKRSAPIIMAPASTAKSGGGRGRRKKWISLDSLTDELIQQQPEPVSKTPYQELQSAMGPLAISDSEIERFLTSSDFSLPLAVERMIAAQGLAPEPDAEEISASVGEMGIKDNGSAQERSNYTKEQLASRVVCRFFVRDGRCMRGSTCMYSHDTAHRVCRFWLRGACVLEPKCSFGHSIPESVRQSLREAQQRAASRANKPEGQPLSKSVAAPEPFKHEPINQQLANPLLRPPKTLPWHSKLPVHVEYTLVRDEARKISYLRNKYLDSSKEAFLVNNAGDAKRLSDKGRHFEMRMVQLLRAGAELLAAEAKEPASDNFVDLHGLDLEEAMDLLRKNLHDAQVEGKANFRALYCITGSGHYKAKPYPDALTLRVRKYLDDHEFGNVQVDAGEYGRVTAIDPFSGRV